MNQSLRKKLCWSCDGEVSLSEESCPYCGVTVIPASLDGPGNAFAPPYAGSFVEQNQEVPKSPYALEETSLETQDLSSEKKESNEDLEPALDAFKTSATAIFSLLSGSVFLLFSLALALFSHHGTLTLKWDSTFWYVYGIAALALLLLGWKSLMKIEDRR